MCVNVSAHLRIGKPAKNRSSQGILFLYFFNTFSRFLPHWSSQFPSRCGSCCCYNSHCWPGEGVNNISPLMRVDLCQLLLFHLSESELHHAWRLRLTPSHPAATMQESPAQRREHSPSLASHRGSLHAASDGIHADLFAAGKDRYFIAHNRNVTL